jgi:hypothetical protein
LDLEFLYRVRKTSIISALLLFPAIAAYLGIAAGASLLLGCAWSLANLFFIALLVRTMCANPENKRFRLALILMVKMPVLYACGFFLLKSGWLTVSGLLAGFMWPLFIITLKAMGRMILRLDGGNQPFVGAGPNTARKRS